MHSSFPTNTDAHSAPLQSSRGFVASVRRGIKNKGHLVGCSDYGLLELFAASGKRTIFLDVSRHHFASKDGIIALSSLSLARVRRTA